MALMKNTIITKKGQALMAKLIAGTATTSFTKVALSSQAYKQSDLEKLTSIGGVKQQEKVTRVTRTNESTIRVESAVTNTELTTGYHVNTIGLYAKDPTEGEILYSVTIAEEADFMPAYNGVTSTGIYLKLITTVSNSVNVSVEVDPAAVATIADFNRVYDLLEYHLESRLPHKYKVDDKNYHIGFEVVDGQPRIFYEEAN